MNIITGGHHTRSRPYTKLVNVLQPRVFRLCEFICHVEYITLVVLMIKQIVTIVIVADQLRFQGLIWVADIVLIIGIPRVLVQIIDLLSHNPLYLPTIR